MDTRAHDRTIDKDSWMDIIRGRRTVRAYTSEQISDEALESVLEAAIWAPYGSSEPSWRFTVLQKPEHLETLRTTMRAALAAMPEESLNYRAKHRAKAAAQNPDFNFFYQAPTLIIVSNERDYPNALADSAVAMQNMFLTAHVLGLGTCWINQIVWVDDAKNNPAVRALLSSWGIPENHHVYGSVALGYPSSTPSPRPRKTDVVRLV